MWSESDVGSNPIYPTVLFLDRLKDLGFGYAFRSGLSISIDDIMIPKDKDEISPCTQGRACSGYRHSRIGKLRQNPSKGAGMTGILVKFS